MNIMENINKKLPTIAVLGTGYVGLPIINLLAKKASIIAYDIDKKRILRLSKNNNNKNIVFTNDKQLIKKADAIIVCVPTPTDNQNKPDLNYLKQACIIIAQNMKEGVLIIFESSYMPTCTEKMCIPLLEEYSGLKNDVNFYVGYSPERINPGDTKNTLSNITKLIASPSKDVLKAMRYIYSGIGEINVYEVDDIKVAEMSKLVENCQRDINIAFSNELSVLCHKLGIDINEVINSAGTKWNFAKYYPGLVGGGCVGVNSYYLMDLAEQYNIEMKSLKVARQVNSSITKFIVEELNRMVYNIENTTKDNIKVVIYGYTYKEDIPDTRNTKVENLYRELLAESYNVCICDYNVTSCDYVSKEDINNADVIILAVPHKKYINWDKKELNVKYNLKSKYKIFMDLKSSYKTKEMSNMINYWHL